MSDERARLEALARQVRGFLEPHWAEWHRRAGSLPMVSDSQGTCGRSSLFLRDVLRGAGFDAEFAAGSPVEHHKGFRSKDGWHGHAWVRAGGWIVDVTADQFGGPAVLMTGADDPRYSEGTDTAEPEFIAIRQAVARDLMTAWHARQTGGNTCDLQENAPL